MARVTAYDGSLGSLARDMARRGGNRPALRMGKRVTSFEELDRASDAGAAAFIKGGARPGERVAYLGKNSDKYFVLLFAVAKAGLVLVPIGWRLPADDVAYQLADSGASYLFFEPEFNHLVREAGTESIRLVSMENSHGKATGYSEWLSAADNSLVNLPDVDRASTALQLYTSGTTGRPKGVLIPHDRLLALRDLSREDRPAWDIWDANEASLLALPVAHIAGTGWGIVSLHSGAELVIQPEFDPADVLRSISEDRINRVLLVPTTINFLLRNPGVTAGDYSRLRYIYYGASPIALSMLKEAMAVFGCDFVQNYGMTETCGPIAVLPPEDHDAEGNERMKSAGKALPGVTIQIIDEQGQQLAPGCIGQIAIRSPSNMAGYWNRPDATVEAQEDGWIRTGDAGYLDPEGYLFLCDRLNDLIISGGENVYPTEVENALCDHPMVAEAVVIGIPDPQWGEAVTAIVVAADTAPDANEILARIREKLPSYKVPKQILFRNALPRNANGKILRKELRAPFWEQPEGNLD